MGNVENYCVVLTETRLPSILLTVIIKKTKYKDALILMWFLNSFLAIGSFLFLYYLYDQYFRQISQ